MITLLALLFLATILAIYEASGIEKGDPWEYWLLIPLSAFVHFGGLGFRFLTRLLGHEEYIVTWEHGAPRADSPHVKLEEKWRKQQ